MRIRVEVHFPLTEDNVASEKKHPLITSIPDVLVRNGGRMRDLKPYFSEKLRQSIFPDEVMAHTRLWPAFFERSTSSYGAPDLFGLVDDDRIQDVIDWKNVLIVKMQARLGIEEGLLSQFMQEWQPRIDAEDGGGIDEMEPPKNKQFRSYSPSYERGLGFQRSGSAGRRPSSAKSNERLNRLLQEKTGIPARSSQSTTSSVRGDDNLNNSMGKRVSSDQRYTALQQRLSQSQSVRKTMR